jgi:hypothetical protein
MASSSSADSFCEKTRAEARPCDGKRKDGLIGEQAELRCRGCQR